MLLAPRGECPAAEFDDVRGEAQLYENILARVQRFRGSVYTAEGNLVPTDLSPDGRHQQPGDGRSWHLLTVDRADSIMACARLLFHEPGAAFSELMVSHCALARSKTWRRMFREAVEALMSAARRRGMRFAELGGWAIARDFRCTTEAARMVLAGYALGEKLGGVLGISTVNLDHGSASILRRMGGECLMSDSGPFPPFFEPQYRANLEILCFDSSRASVPYDSYVSDCRTALQAVMVTASGQLTPPYAGAEAWRSVS
jgi:hypothetical protein